MKKSAKPAGKIDWSRADAMTAKPATVPAALACPMPIGYLSGSPGYLVWTTGTELMVEQPDSGALSRYHRRRSAPTRLDTAITWQFRAVR